MILLIHLLLSSVSVECTSFDSFLRLFRNYVNYHFIFPKNNKRGRVGIRGGLENFSKINKRGGGRDDYSVLESTCKLYLGSRYMYLNSRCAKKMFDPLIGSDKSYTAPVWKIYGLIFSKELDLDSSILSLVC